MTSYTVHGTPANHSYVQYVIGKLTEDSTNQTVYVSSWFDRDLGLGGTGNDPSKKDAYYFGAIINKTYPNNTVAKQGIQDYDVTTGQFNYFGVSNPYNSGKFNSVDGFVSDSYNGGDSSYPDPSLINTTYLPTYTEMLSLQTTGISFYNSGDNPGF